MTISLRLQLWTEHGPAGHRLERSVPLPIKEFDYPDSEEGRRSADQAKEHLQNYVDKHLVPKARK